MDFNLFLRTITQEVSKHLPKGSHVTCRKIPKNNQIEYTGLYIEQGKKKDFSPVLYMEPVFAELVEKKKPGSSRNLKEEDISVTEGDIQSITDRIVSMLLSPTTTPAFLSEYSDYEKIKSRIIARLVGQELNPYVGEFYPHRPYLDMDVLYSLYIDNDNGFSGTALISYTLMERWGVTEAELFRVAMTNMPEILGDEVHGIGNYIGQTDDASPYYVLSNREMFFGASTLLYTEKLRLLSDTWQCNLYVLPSSVHEVLIVPEATYEADTLRELVRHVNRTELKKEDILTDSVYYYSREKKTLSLA